MEIYLNKDYFKSDKTRLIKEKGYFTPIENIINWVTKTLVTACMAPVFAISSLVSSNFLNTF